MEYLQYEKDDSEDLPPGWSTCLRGARKIYLTPSPKSVKIDSRAKLLEYHERGRFLEMNVDQLKFGKRKLKPFDIASFDCQDNVVDKDTTDLKEVFEAPHTFEEIEIEKSSTAKLKKEQITLSESVLKLTKDTSKDTDHKALLEDSARKLNALRLKTLNLKSNLHSDPELLKLQDSLLNCSTEEELVRVIWSSPNIQKRLISLLSSRFLEQVMGLGFKKENPLSNFPPNLNKNLYTEIIDTALVHSEDLLLTLLALTVKNESPVSAKDVVQLAYLFATIAESVDPGNNVMKKVKSLDLKSCGLTNHGLDSLAAVGATVTSRSYRNDRDMLAGISEEIAKQYAKKGIPQFTFDNMDLQINNIMHHFTLNFMEFESKDTSGFKTAGLAKSDMLEFFTLDTVLLDEDKTLLDHYKFVTTVTLGRFLGKEIPGLGWMLEVLPRHYHHPNRDTAGNKSLIHVSKPLYYQETVNDDMMKIMSALQLEYLTLVGQQAEDKEGYFSNLRKMLSVDCSEEEREAAEKVVRKQVLLSGELICHGDQLTNERFESCKRLAQGSSSAFERFEFMPIFRLGTFHMRMSKTIQDLENGMPSVVNREDELSYGYFRTILGLTHITNNVNSIKKDFEKHDQFCLEVGKEIIKNAFKTVMEPSAHTFPRNLQGAQDLILAFLSKADIKFYYELENYDEKEPYDDVLSACRSYASRTVMSMIADTVVHESDGLGCRAVRTAMILYFLNKKLAQTSKYAASLLVNKIYFLGASEKTKKRIDYLACCNPKGGAGNGLDRDIVNEHKVRECKDVFKGLHSQLRDIVVTKSVLGENVISMIRSHDNDSIQYHAPNSKTQQYMTEDEKLRISSELNRVQPFSQERQKIEYYDKISGSPFTGLTKERIMWFLKRNQSNFKKSYPHKNL